MNQTGFIVLVFLVSFGTAVLPQFITKILIIKKVYTYLTALAAGFLFAVLMLEFIPHLFSEEKPHCTKHDLFTEDCTGCKDASTGHGKHHGGGHKGHEEHNDGNTKGLIAAGTAFLLLIAVDSLFLHHTHCPTENHAQHDHDSIGTCNTSALKYTTSISQAIILIAALSLHSFFEGMAFSKKNNVKGLTGMEQGLVIHKILESFAIGVTMAASQFSTLSSILLLLLYSVLTPLGIIMANGLIKYRKICDGLALGSTMFIVCVEMIPTLLHSKHKRIENVGIVGCLGAGFVLTSILLTHNGHCH